MVAQWHQKQWNKSQALAQALAQQQAAMSAQQQAYLNAMYAQHTSMPTLGSALNSYWINSGIATSTATTTTLTVPLSTGSIGAMPAPEPYFDDDGGRYKLHLGHDYVLELPDGAYLKVSADGSYNFISDDAKVRYKAAPRDFNPFLNASDKIEDFIKFCGQHGVRKDEMLQLPLKLFIAWLVIEAAKADQEPPPDLPLLPELQRRSVPRCDHCGRFMKRAAKLKKLEVCRTECFEARMAA